MKDVIYKRTYSAVTTKGKITVDGEDDVSKRFTSIVGLRR